jgi:hypothetical protein
MVIVWIVICFSSRPADEAVACSKYTDGIEFDRYLAGSDLDDLDF